MTNAPNRDDWPVQTNRPKTAIFRSVLKAAGVGDPYQNLPSILSAAERAADPADRVLALAHLVDWIRGSSVSPFGEGAKSANARFRFLLGLLQRHAAPRLAVARLVASVFRDAEAPSLFAQTELNEQGGIFSEALRRLGDQILPPPPRPRELAYAASVSFIGADDAEWIEAIDAEDWLRFCDALDSDPERRLDATALFADLRDAVVNASLQTAALGLSEEVRARTSGGDGRADAGQRSGAGGSPFVALARLTSRWRDSGADGDAALIREAIDECQAAVVAAYAAVETKGVSLALVYRLETISSLLRRQVLLLDFLKADLSPRERRLRARDLLVAIVRTRLARRSIRELFGMNFDIFARRLVKHAGETGEHYIARTRAEWRDMLASGAGGGLVTVGTTFLKFAIYSLKASPFAEGVLVWANYSGSFIAMQFMGFTLATKQPSMTSAALADKLSRRMEPSQIDEFVEEIACISRSQFIAAVGNVSFVFGGALCASVFFERLSGHPVLAPEQARHALEALHPLRTGTLAYAAFTGALLWLSSFGAGFLQNWTIYRGLPEAIAQHRLTRGLFGVGGARAIGRWVGRNASGLGGNLAIGFLLAFVPVLGRFFGLPLDVRHVTLSSGTVAVAFKSLGFASIGWRTAATYAASIAAIGALNFFVSTACALAVAARAQRVRRAWFRAVIGYAWRAFFRQPLRFFAPPKT